MKFTAAVWLVLTAALSAYAAEAFVEETPADAPGAWATVSGSAWHGGKKYVGGLGFEVTVEGWPRLVQRGHYDVFTPHNSNREAFPRVAWQDYGLIRTGPDSSPVKLVRDTWCHRQYAIASGEQAMTLHVSRLTPAVLCTTESNGIELFAGEKYAGRVKEQKRSTVPAHAAFVREGKVTVSPTDRVVDTSGMDECWVLLWFGRSSFYRRTAIPNILWRATAQSKFMNEPNGYFRPSDMPVLVVFRNRPASLRAVGDAIRIEFPEKAGSVALLPLLGFYHVPVAETEKWAQSLPDDIVSRCRTWARRLKCYPTGCRELRRVAGGGKDVAIRYEYSFLELPDVWATKAEKLAPVPPAAALAKRYGFDVEISGKLAPLAIPTHSGPYTGIADSDAVELTVHGMDRYINEAAAPGETTSESAKVLVEELREEVAKMVDAGPLAPVTSFRPAKFEAHFRNPAETLLALSEALTYLDGPGREEAVEYILDELKRANPARAKTAGVMYAKAANRNYRPNVPPPRRPEWRIRQEERANSAYAFWAFAAGSGDWERVKANYDAVRAQATSPLRAREWAICGYFQGGSEARGGAAAARGEDRGSAQAVNGRFARWVGLARLARRYGDTDTADRCAYLLARCAMNRAALGAIVGYMYDEKFQTIEDPGWMYKYSSGSGESGPGLLWSKHWAGEASDLRTVVRWDEFAPCISQCEGDHWRPIWMHLQDLTPECGRLCANVEILRRRTAVFVAGVERNCPAWYMTNREANVGKEIHLDDPRNSCGVFLGKCHVLGVPGSEMLKYQDIPFVRVGDLYHIRRLVANLRCFGGLKWKYVGDMQ